MPLNPSIRPGVLTQQWAFVKLFTGVCFQEFYYERFCMIPQVENNRRMRLACQGGPWRVQRNDLTFPIFRLRLHKMALLWVGFSIHRKKIISGSPSNNG